MNRDNPIEGKITNSDLCPKMLRVSTLSVFIEDETYGQVAASCVWLALRDPSSWIGFANLRPSCRLVQRIGGYHQIVNLRRPKFLPTVIEFTGQDGRGSS